MPVRFEQLNTLLFLHLQVALTINSTITQPKNNLYLTLTIILRNLLDPDDMFSQAQMLVKNETKVHTKMADT